MKKGDIMNYNVITHEDSVEVINEKLKTEEYAGLNDEQLHTRLVNEATFDPSLYILINGKLVRREAINN